jgi:hypothetical protein
MAKRNTRREPLMVRVWAELGAGRIREGWISDPGAFVAGQCEATGHITINPMIDVVDTLLHEILHRLYPAWSEAYVKRTTTYLLRRMTDGEIQTFYAEYERRVRRKKRA